MDSLFDVVGRGYLVAVGVVPGFGRELVGYLFRDLPDEFVISSHLFSYS